MREWKVKCVFKRETGLSEGELGQGRNRQEILKGQTGA